MSSRRNCVENHCASRPGQLNNTQKGAVTMASTAGDSAPSQAKDNADSASSANNEESEREEGRRDSLWSRFRNLSQRGGMNNAKGGEPNDDLPKEEEDKKPPPKQAVTGDVAAKKDGGDGKNDSVPQLKDEQDYIDDGDKKPAAKDDDAPPKKEEMYVPPVTMEEAIYSKDRMVKALKKLGPFLQPEPSADESGELDSVMERKFSVKDLESAKAIFNLMKLESDAVFSPECKLLTIAAFRNSRVRDRDLMKDLLEERGDPAETETEPSSDMVALVIIDQWKYQACKNLEHLATTDGAQEKNWYHAVTASFLVMECLQLVWDCLITVKKEQVIDKKKQLIAAHEKYGLEWNQPGYLNDVEACGKAIESEAITGACGTTSGRLSVVNRAREFTRPGNNSRPYARRNPPRRNNRTARPPDPMEEFFYGIEPRESTYIRDMRQRAEQRRAERRTRQFEAHRAAARAAAEDNANNENNTDGARQNDELTGNNDADGARRNDAASDNNERPPVEGNDARTRTDGEEAAAGNNERHGEAVNRDRARDPRVVQMTFRANSANVVVGNNERLEREGNAVDVDRALREVEADRAIRARAEADRAHEPFLRGLHHIEAISQRAADEPVFQVDLSNAGADRAVAASRAARNRENDDFSENVARVAVPHVVEQRRAELARALRNGEDRAAAIARDLELEEDELLWGPRLPARRRLMMARRARDPQLDPLEALEEFDMLARMEALELDDHFGFDFFTGAFRPPPPPPPPRRPSQRPEVHIPLPHLRELDELKEAAELKPFSRTEGLELVSPSPDFDAERILIKRVTACVGWAIHGLIFEFVDGTRMGTLMVNPGERPMRLHDKNLTDRNCVGWTNVEHGDYIVGMHGDKLAPGVQKWFCYSLTITFASGMQVSYEANHEPWRGEPFSFDVPRTTPCFVHRISFKNDQAEDMLGIVTSIHLPLSRKNFAHLPRKQQEAVEEILEIAKDVDLKLEYRGCKPMGEDVWWLILGFVRGWEVLPPSINAKGTKDGQHLFDLYAKRNWYRQAS